MISSILVLDYALRLKILHTIPKQSEFQSNQNSRHYRKGSLLADEIIKILKKICQKEQITGNYFTILIDFRSEIKAEKQMK